MYSLIIARTDDRVELRIGAAVQNAEAYLSACARREADVDFQIVANGLTREDVLNGWRRGIQAHGVTHVQGNGKAARETTAAERGC